MLAINMDKAKAINKSFRSSQGGVALLRVMMTVSPIQQMKSKTREDRWERRWNTQIKQTYFFEIPMELLFQAFGRSVLSGVSQENVGLSPNLHIFICWGLDSFCKKSSYLITVSLFATVVAWKQDISIWPRFSGHSGASSDHLWSWIIIA